MAYNRAILAGSHLGGNGRPGQEAAGTAAAVSGQGSSSLPGPAAAGTPPAWRRRRRRSREWRVAATQLAPTAAAIRQKR